jgi:hypothetical protein
LRRFAFVLGIVGALIVLALPIAGWLFLQHRAAPTPATVCSRADAPCVKLTEADGTVYKLNDWRFQPHSCITFTSLPDNQQRHYCGLYRLDWIGPEPPHSASGILRG